MSDFSVSSTSSGGWDSQTFGAAVVGKTLDYMNGVASSPVQPVQPVQAVQAGQAVQAAPWDKQTFGAAVVSKTLDYMNSPGLGSTGGSGSARSTGWSGSMSADYDFQKSVLGPAYSGAGALVDVYA
ncbi:hypothetical protein [Nitratidesulfovibrio sp. 1201_IL3209]|uniref:hypothetical protein n=1 Tax=Nitratidesulfovibrio sp. 1201_IL3209 TaxID=3084053 RepID=UPI002FD8B2A2